MWQLAQPKAPGSQLPAGRPHTQVCHMPLSSPSAHSLHPQRRQSGDKSTRPHGGRTPLTPAHRAALRLQFPHLTTKGSLPSCPFLLGLSRTSNRLIHTKVCMTDPGFRIGGRTPQRRVSDPGAETTQPEGKEGPFGSHAPKHLSIPGGMRVLHCWLSSIRHLLGQHSLTGGVCHGHLQKGRLSAACPSLGPSPGPLRWVSTAAHHFNGLTQHQRAPHHPSHDSERSF